MEVIPLPIQMNPRPADPDARPRKGDVRPTLLKRRVEMPPPGLMSVTQARSPYLTIRTVVDRLIALVLLVAAAPVIALAAALVKMTSRGPAFYSQTRLGLRGRLFTIYK